MRTLTPPHPHPYPLFLLPCLSLFQPSILSIFFFFTTIQQYFKSLYKRKFTLYSSNPPNEFTLFKN
ncbi:hypothetical protein EJD97_018973 [Solanum chilense]|uniref:Uncharacterized protein n=1 Tax=Solanum chilense TaxID=4083 RepID=A0A6N2AZY4_SOLCI|nr:hypothetical protein EJD97_018973 [Solanum chilense]